MADPADLGLLARAVAGDGAAFAALAGPHRRAVFRHCYRMLGSGADAEDATQDVLERAWRKLATYDGTGPFGAWLQRIATNICLDGLRARRTRIGPAGYGLPAAPGTAPSPYYMWRGPAHFYKGLKDKTTKKFAQRGNRNVCAPGPPSHRPRLLRLQRHPQRPLQQRGAAKKAAPQRERAAPTRPTAGREPARG